MTQVIVVAPIEGGWLVQRGSGEPWSFGTAAQAEWSARRLAEALAEGGERVEIQLHLESGEASGRWLWRPAQPLAAPERQAAREPA